MAGTIDFSVGFWVDTDEPADGINDAPAAAVFVDLEGGFYSATSSGGATSGDTTTATNAIGTNGADFLGAWSGGSSLHGMDGNDSLSGIDGNDTLSGGAGDDAISDFLGTAVAIDGGADNDIIFIGTSFTSGSIHGGADFDVLQLSFDTPVDLSSLTLSGLEALQTEFSLVTATAAQFDGFDTIFARERDREVNLVLAAVGSSTTLNLSDELGDNGGRGLYLTGSSDSENVTGSLLRTNIMHGGGGADTLSGGNVDDYFWGEAGNDTLNGGADADQLYGGADDDTLNGGGDDDYLQGDEGNDTLDGNDGDDLLRAGAGADTANGGIGHDSLEGGDGNDTLNGGTDNDDLFGEDGDDTLNGGSGQDEIAGGDDNDTLNGDADDDTLWGEDGDDILNGGTGKDGIDGGAGKDTIDGGDDDDLIVGGDGDDVIDGGSGTDGIDGGDGDDTIKGGAGRDFISDLLGTRTTISGNDGDDLIGIKGFSTGSIDGGSGDDLLGIVETVDLTGLTLTSLEALETNGRTVRGRVADFDPFTMIVKSISGIATPVDLGGRVTLELIATGGATELDLVGALGDNGGRGIKLTGTSDDETIVAGKLKENEIYGLGGKDKLTGGDEKDTIDGGVENDEIVGGKGADTLHGGANDDTISAAGALGVTGDAGNNSLFGDGGDDKLISWFSGSTATPDQLTGGAGKDTFFVDTIPNKVDRILDFSDGEQAFSSVDSDVTRWTIISGKDGTKVNFFSAARTKVATFEFDTRILPQDLSIDKKLTFIGPTLVLTRQRDDLAHIIKFASDLRPFYKPIGALIYNELKDKFTGKAGDFLSRKALQFVTEKIVNNNAALDLIIKVLTKYKGVFENLTPAQIKEMAEEALEHVGKFLADVVLDAIRLGDYAKAYENKYLDAANFVTIPFQVTMPGFRTFVKASEYIHKGIATSIELYYADETFRLMRDLPDEASGSLGPLTINSGAGGKVSYIQRASDLTSKLGSSSANDQVYSTVTVKSLPGNVEDATLLSPAAGKAAAKLLVGNKLENHLAGNSAANIIKGLGGDDTLTGEAANDTLVGGKGRDTLTGGAGKDVFDYNAVTETGKTAATRDVITDFKHGTDDIDLSTIDASTKAAGNQTFKFIGTQKFHKVAGELHYVKENPAGTAKDKTIVEGDVNGDGKADFQIELTGLKTLTAADFVL